ncbi:MAG: CopG family transcriptional regulator [Candidatus Omnitrophica bacterium CG11_big_fil_rev_8_21_14_0_20_64_10]|nr:MAG: CopG family transcriptional regulator [Candidatus Omnitrophica bacterium CG11_big_fil_rev_8_21_14_0_20_64_10]
MRRSTAQWTVSLPRLLSREAEKTAKEESRTKSELVREALRRYLGEQAFRRAQGHLSRRLRSLGVRTEEDVERLIDEGRN